MLAALGIGKKPSEGPKKSTSNTKTNTSQKQLERRGSRMTGALNAKGKGLDGKTKGLIQKNSGTLIKKLSGFLMGLASKAENEEYEAPPTERIELTQAQ